MAENRDQDMGRNQDQSRSSDTGSGMSGSQSGATGDRSSRGLGGQSQGTSAGSEYDGQILEGGDSGRGGSTGTGNTDTSRSEDLDSRPGEGGM